MFSIWNRHNFFSIRNDAKYLFVLVATLIVAANLNAQSFAGTQPAGKENGSYLAIPRVISSEIGATAKDFVTFRDKQWEVLTLAQIGAAAADADTSLYNLGHCSSCREIGPSRFVLGSRPDAHKYIVAGLVEITMTAVAGHYLRNHSPMHKWYWRFAWTLPQSFSIYEHAHASFQNAGSNLGCGAAGQYC